MSIFPPLLAPGLDTCLPSLGYSNDSRELALLVAVPFLSHHAEGLKVLPVCPSLTSFTLALGFYLLKSLTISSRLPCSFCDVNFLYFFLRFVLFLTPCLPVDMCTFMQVTDIPEMSDAPGAGVTGGRELLIVGSQN